MADIVIINPRFEPSYWGMDHLLPFMGKAANLPVACLPLLAALTPEEHTVTLLDENAEEIDFERCARADIVAMTGMSVQRFRMKEILGELKARGCFVAIGGPWITVQEDYFDDEPADAIFIGEAEETWPQFLREWKQGLNQYRYEQVEKTDMTKVPTPRFDMLDMKRYAFGSLQFSRGCPFQCEFCDIIVTFGRRPRIKTTEQVIAELEAIWKTGLRIAFVVDDNLIGNKKAIKEVLREVVVWQRKNGYPLSLFTEASIDLADDQELMDLMVEANFVATFIGIESPSEESLRETKKFQNVRDGGTLLEKVHRIQNSGMEVWCGMIMGFDSDDVGIFERQIEFIQQSRISFSMSGMLSAIPKTPLHARLAAEGRLDPADRSEFGTNVIPLKMSREELLDGYFEVLNRLYEPQAYFDRTDALFMNPNFDYGITLKKKWWKISRRWFLSEMQSAVEGLGLFARLMKNVPEPELRKEYRKRFMNFIKVHRRPGLVMFYVFHMAMHYHTWKMARSMSSRSQQLVNSF
ncbi:B12-binding domain-containing radical SAM protein [Planctomyces sp. SH-PL62]|uniref:B12-binding domain-containing radical SAM protein n=1 Tax=Planctomyces sp. SH-PL62 TaxID=1636152 RepID=UPI00078D81A7|nr:radical SAM protein [Planctomyces sp. SH-PL62]AMV37426.1 Radical SAM superfamily protein [Planctomyces sp. SH-PL62]